MQSRREWQNSGKTLPLTLPPSESCDCGRAEAYVHGLLNDGIGLPPTGLGVFGGFFHELGLLRESTRKFTIDGVVRFFAALIVTGALVGMGGASSSAPSRYARDIVTQLTIGSPEAAWRSLHPAHQKVAPRGQFARCVYLMRGASVFHIRVTVGGWRKVSIGRAEILQRSGWSVRLVITRRGSGVKFKEDRKLQVVQVGRRLRWLLDKSTYSQYRKGVSSTTCPVEP